MKMPPRRKDPKKPKGAHRKSMRRRSRQLLFWRRLKAQEAAKVNPADASQSPDSVLAEVTKKEESGEDSAKAQLVTVVKTEPYNFVISTEQVEDEQGRDQTSEDERAADSVFCAEDKPCDEERAAGVQQSNDSASRSRTCGHMRLRPGHRSPQLRTALVRKRRSTKALQQVKSGRHKVVRRFCRLHPGDKLKKAAGRSSACKSSLADESFMRFDSMLNRQHWEQETKDESCVATKLDLKEMLALPPFKVTSRFLNTYSRPRERRPLSNVNVTKEDATSQTSDHADDGACMDDSCKIDRTVQPPSATVVSAAVNSETVRESSLLVRESKACKAEESSSRLSDVTKGRHHKCAVHAVIKMTNRLNGTVDRLHSTTSPPWGPNILSGQSRLEMGASQQGATLLVRSGSIRTASQGTVAATSSETSSCLSTHGSLRQKLRVLWNVGTQTNLRKFSKWTQTASLCC